MSFPGPGNPFFEMTAAIQLYGSERDLPPNPLLECKDGAEADFPAAK